MKVRHSQLHRTQRGKPLKVVRAHSTPTLFRVKILLEIDLTDFTVNGGNLDWINDGFCDDMNNNEDCNYDGGECCGTLTNKRYCLDCQCIRKEYET